MKVATLLLVVLIAALSVENVFTEESKMEKLEEMMDALVKDIEKIKEAAGENDAMNDAPKPAPVAKDAKSPGPHPTPGPGPYPTGRPGPHPTPGPGPYPTGRPGPHPTPGPGPYPPGRPGPTGSLEEVKKFNHMLKSIYNLLSKEGKETANEYLEWFKKQKTLTQRQVAGGLKEYIKEVRNEVIKRVPETTNMNLKKAFLWFSKLEENGKKKVLGMIKDLFWARLKEETARRQSRIRNMKEVVLAMKQLLGEKKLEELIQSYEYWADILEAAEGGKRGNPQDAILGILTHVLDNL